MVWKSGMIVPPLQKDLIAIATAYAKATGLKMAQVSKKFYGNSAFFAEFKRGSRSISIHKFDEMVGQFQAKWPDGIGWPDTESGLIGNPPEKSPG